MGSEIGVFFLFPTIDITSVQRRCPCMQSVHVMTSLAVWLSYVPLCYNQVWIYGLIAPKSEKSPHFVIENKIDYVRLPCNSYWVALQQQLGNPATAARKPATAAGKPCKSCWVAPQQLLYQLMCTRLLIRRWPHRLQLKDPTPKCQLTGRKL